MRSEKKRKKLYKCIKRYSSFFQIAQDCLFNGEKDFRDIDIHLELKHKQNKR